MVTMTATAATAVRGVLVAITLLGAIFPSALHGRDDVADRLFDQAGQAQNSGDFEFAAELWDKFLSDHPKDPQSVKARHYAGVCRMTLKQYDSAIQAFTAVIDHENAGTLPQLEESYYYLGWCQFSVGQQDVKNSRSLQNAIRTFDKQIKKFGKGKFLDQAYFLKGESLYFLGRKEQSIAAYSEVVEKFSKSSSRPNAIYALGVSQFEINRYGDCEKTFELFLSEYSEDDLADDVRLFQNESVLQRGLKKLPEDRKAAEELIAAAKKGLSDLVEKKGFAKRDEALFNLALCDSQLGKPKAAAQSYASVATEFGNSVFGKQARMSAGKLFLRTRDYPNAEKWLKEVATRDADQADEANHWLCQVYLRQNRPKQAAAIAEAAIPKAKGDYLVRLKMDQADALYAIPASQKKSIDLYEVIATDHAEHSLAPQSLYNAAFACLETRVFDRGLKLTEQFIADHPQDTFLPDAKYVRAECFLLSRKHRDAENAYRDLLENHARKSSIESWRVRYALTLYLQDKYQETIDSLSTHLDELKNEGQQAEANFLIGASGFYQKKSKAAIKSLTRAVSYGKKLKQADEALILLAQAHASEKQYEQALANLDQLFTQHAGSRYIPQGNYLAGQNLSLKKSFAAAIEKYDTVLAGTKNKYTPYAHYGRGWALLNSKQPEESKSAFAAIIDDWKEHALFPDACYSRAVARRRTKDYKGTVSDIEACLAALRPPTSRLRILCPFDPVVRDRARLERLLGFEYRIEIFVPAAKRRWGY